MLISIAACNKKGSSNTEEVLAEYNGNFLYRTDIPEDILGKFKEGGDSTGLLKSFIDKWLENQVMVAVANEKLSDEEKNKEKLIEDYRNSLLIYEYQQKLMKENLDTAVTESEIAAFYKDNSETFLLRKNIVKIKYVKILKQKADLNKLKKLMQTASPENDQLLMKLAESNAENFYLDSNWLYLDDITKEIPLDENYNQQRFLANNKFIQIEENNMLYLLYIIDFRIKNAISPLAFERDKIKDIILYKRQLNFLKDNQKKLFDKAVSSGAIKYHIKK
ncbi:MAG: hypothetical protein ACKOXF_01640 [Chitinophagaceae bacterium]